MALIADSSRSYVNTGLEAVFGLAMSPHILQTVGNITLMGDVQSLSGRQRLSSMTKVGFSDAGRLLYLTQKG